MEDNDSEIMKIIETLETKIKYKTSKKEMDLITKVKVNMSFLFEVARWYFGIFSFNTFCFVENMGKISLIFNNKNVLSDLYNLGCKNRLQFIKTASQESESLHPICEWITA